MMRIEETLQRLQTPFYVFDTDASAARALALRKQLPARVKLCYAMKANPFLLRGLEGAVDGFEVCSPGELRICRRSGVDMGKVVLSGIYKAPEDLEDVLEEYGSRITYTAESLRQWTLLAAGAERLGLKVPVLLRLTMGNQFGMDPELIRKILSEPHPWIAVRGIQFFSGTQKKAPGRILRELRELDAFLDELELKCGYRPQLLEYGPGLPVCYFEGEKDAAPELVAALCQGLEQMRYQGAVALELGRWLAACSGTYVTRIVDVKTNLGPVSYTHLTLPTIYSV